MPDADGAILACVASVDAMLGHGVGIAKTTQVLRGGRGREILDAGLDRAEGYGSLRSLGEPDVRDRINALVDAGRLTVGEFRTIMPGAGRGIA